MATIVGRLGTALLQCEKLVAKIDEGRSAALGPKFEIEQSTVEGQSLFNVTDLKRYVVETNSSRFFRLGMGLSRSAWPVKTMPIRQPYRHDQKIRF